MSEAIIAAYRFIHAADVHLDSPLCSLALRERDLAELIGNATRKAFVRIIDFCLAEQVDALLLAGDLYDGDQTSMKTARFLAEQLRRLSEAGIRVFIVRGNHDAMSRITNELVFPDTVKIFGGRAEAVPVDKKAGAFPVVVHGLSFSHPRATESLLGKYKQALPDAVNIGLMHTSLSGAPGHDDYAPCGLNELKETGFQYWALGHVHKRMVEQGECTIVMPGIPQGRDINESGAKSVTLVTIQDDRSVNFEERFTSVAQFERVHVDATGIDDWKELVVKIGHALAQAQHEIRSEHLVARLHFAGETPLAWRIRRDIELLTTEAKERASVIGGCWVEKIETACRPPSTATQEASDPLMELRRLIQEKVASSEIFRAELSEVAEELRKKLPRECQGIFGVDEPTFNAGLALMAGEGMEDVLARLQASEKGEQN
ncbi:MAG: exonuclease SbcCD subunit D [Alphaproteobacteria bacterium]|nr:exonuclease SbcCD subunit D [Alphaproteobacteria bacterium]